MKFTVRAGFLTSGDAARLRFTVAAPPGIFTQIPLLSRSERFGLHPGPICLRGEYSTFAPGVQARSGKKAIAAEKGVPFCRSKKTPSRKPQLIAGAAVGHPRGTISKAKKGGESASLLCCFNPALPGDPATLHSSLFTFLFIREDNTGGRPRYSCSNRGWSCNRIDRTASRSGDAGCPGRIRQS